MPRHALLFSSIAAALGAACAEPPVTAPPAPAAAATPSVIVSAAPRSLRGGMGHVDSIANRRLGIAMDDGTMQYVDADPAGIEIGARVELSRDLWNCTAAGTCTWRLSPGRS